MGKEQGRGGRGAPGCCREHPSKGMCCIARPRCGVSHSSANALDSFHSSPILAFFLFSRDMASPSGNARACASVTRCTGLRPRRVRGCRQAPGLREGQGGRAGSLQPGCCGEVLLVPRAVTSPELAPAPGGTEGFQLIFSGLSLAARAAPAQKQRCSPLAPSSLQPLRPTPSPTAGPCAGH